MNDERCYWCGEPLDIMSWCGTGSNGTKIYLHTQCAADVERIRPGIFDGKIGNQRKIDDDASAFRPVR